MVFIFQSSQEIFTNGYLHLTKFSIIIFRKNLNNWKVSIFLIMKSQISKTTEKSCLNSSRASNILMGECTQNLWVQLKCNVATVILCRFFISPLQSYRFLLLMITLYFGLMFSVCEWKYSDISQPCLMNTYDMRGLQAWEA